jgi:hypothetical protein
MVNDKDYKKAVVDCAEGKINIKNVPNQILSNQFLRDVYTTRAANGIASDWCQMLEDLPEFLMLNLADDIVEQMINESHYASYYLTKSYFDSKPDRIIFIYNIDPRAVVPIDHAEVFEPLSDDQLIESAKANQSNFLDEYDGGYAEGHYKLFSRRLGFENLLNIIFPLAIKKISDKFESDGRWDVIKSDKEEAKAYLDHMLSEVFEPAIEHAQKNKLVTIEFLRILKKNGFDNFECYLQFSEIIDL